MTASQTRKPVVTVASFLKGGQKLRLELVAGRGGLDRRVGEATLNRPGLPLAGFFEHFAIRRVQVLGLAECAYLDALSPDDRHVRLREFMTHRIPCVVVTRARGILPELRALAEELNVPILRTPMVTKHFVNAATIVMENLMAPRSQIQGTMVEIHGIGVLIEGKSGMGKSEIALGLIKKGHALVADDVTALRLDSSGSIIGSAVEVTRYHMEIRGLGIIHVPSLFGVASVRGEKKLDMVVTLYDPRDDSAPRIGNRQDTCDILGLRLPRVTIPVGPGRDLTNVVESAALDLKLRLLGHDAEKELDERLIAHMTGGANASD